jgi:hypothetical protein
MALTWSVTDICNHEEVTTSPFPDPDTGAPQWHPATQALVWLSVHCGYSEITEKNIGEVADRVRVWEHAVGPTMLASGGPLRVSLDDIHNHIGLRTNASRLTSAQFRKKVMDIITREARLAPNKIHTQLLEYRAATTGSTDHAG